MSFMFRTKLTTKQLVITAGLASFSAIAQLIHLGYQSPQWGMWIDIVAVTWIVAFFLFEIRLSLMVSLLGALAVLLFAPETWLGAGMKWISTVCIMLALFVWALIQKKNHGMYRKPVRLIIPLAIGLVVRSALMLPVNYYFAIPIWTGMTTQQAIHVIPWYVIVVFNTIQTLLDVGLAWLLVFRFKLSKYAAWHTS